MELVLADDSVIDDGALPATLPQRDLVTILGNLIDNAVDAASEAATAPPPEAGLPSGAGVTSGAGTVPGAGVAADSAVVPAQRGAAPRRTGRARVTVTALADDRELLLRVADTGAGVDPDVAAEVFHRGWSTHGAGRGLGLALVQQAVHRAGGTVALGGGPDGGAEFTVRLPLSPSPTQHTPKEPTP